MNKFDKILGRFVIFSVPLVLTLLVWGWISGNPDELSRSEGMTRLLWDTLGWNFMIWILCSLYLVIKMVIKKKFRDIILSKIAGVRERDERESLISGEAAKFSFLSTIAMLFLLLFLSIFTITVAKNPYGLDKSGKRGYISIGMNFFPFSKDVPEKKIIDKNLEILTYTGIPLSSSMVIVLILLWQLGSYKFIIRRASLD